MSNKKSKYPDLQVDLRGMYLCRTLSYRGAEFNIVEAPLEAEMMEMYALTAEFWAKLQLEWMTASAYVTSYKPSTNQLWRLFWASHQEYIFGIFLKREEIEKQKAHEQFMRLQKQGKTEQARKDLDILYYSWSPAMTISSICIIILSMLSSSTTKVDTQRSYSQAELDEMQVELADFLGLYV
ncbi:uncharacterized protein LOC103499968 isoform X1 [Cucumis melo]|uniref:Uncharacterized protein LOC103499968 isoform X1 n=1 Tax=Cucumis melo TaxID=3656 RepID=A0ABM3KDM1_CUCME|nr:uncharacterized protein LOC103499968 isoform X1 [Cucumis melo]